MSIKLTKKDGLFLKKIASYYIDSDNNSNLGVSVSDNSGNEICCLEVTKEFVDAAFPMINSIRERSND